MVRAALEELAVDADGGLDAHPLPHLVAEQEQAGRAGQDGLQLAGEDVQRLQQPQAGRERLGDLVERPQLGRGALDVADGLLGLARDGRAGDGLPGVPLLGPDGHLGDDAVDDLEERLHDDRVEVRPGVLRDDGDGLLVRPGLAVGPGRGQGVVDVGDGQDARRERDVLALQAAGVAGAVPLLVVVLDDRQDGPGEVDGVQDVRAPLRVFLDLLELLVRQAARLEQDVFGNAQLADVVQQRAGVQSLQLVPRQAHLLRRRHRVALDAQDVLVGVLVLGVNSEGEALDGRPVNFFQVFLVLFQLVNVLLLLGDAAGLDLIGLVGQEGHGRAEGQDDPGVVGRRGS